jgi:4-hydroxythreonine-4-phosphate dehydrogenase
MSAPAPTPPLLVTQGDPCGIGPETIARAARDGALDDACVVGDVSVMRRATALVGGWPLAVVERPDDAVPPQSLRLWVPPGLPDGLSALPWGVVDARAGAAAARCIEAAVAQQRAGRGRAIVTAPIHKAALAAAGVPYPGHTEMLQALAGGDRPPPVRMMLANPELRVVLVTIHQSLRSAIAALDLDAVLTTIRIAHRASAAWGQPHPRIAVAGLNPHAGEGGLFGDEEIRFIAPAVQAACGEGIDASGPYAPDTVFMRARRGEFDLVIAMTHDHGLIPVKYLGVEQGVNVTLGLPFVRTSPDHGTAFDIAGRGVADAASLRAALAMARRLTDAPQAAAAAAPDQAAAAPSDDS